MNILIIDDDSLTTTSVKHIIENLGHQATIAHNGEEAINIILLGNFDLIISDIMMPGISGLSLVTVLRTVHLCFTPVIMMSTLHNKHLIEAAMEAGANGFLDKPVAIENLVQKLDQFVNKS